jgi:hypothetical protein
MAGQLRVDELTNEAGTGAPSFPNKITPSSLGTGSPSSANFLRGDGAWSVVAGFDTGTAMMFVQTAAPTGWTKSTTHDNKALRVVSGTASSGGSAAFTTAFGTPSVSGSVSLSGTVGSTTLSTTQIPSHTHTVPFSASSGGQQCGTGAAVQSGSNNTGSTGGGSSHNHSFSGSGSLSSATAAINVQYVDVIIATKD